MTLLIGVPSLAGFIPIFMTMRMFVQGSSHLVLLVGVGIVREAFLRDVPCA